MCVHRKSTKVQKVVWTAVAAPRTVTIFTPCFSGMDPVSGEAAVGNWVRNHRSKVKNAGIIDHLIIVYWKAGSEVIG